MIRTHQQGELGPAPSVLKTGLAFRPFFWFGSVFVVLSLFAWSLFWAGKPPLQPDGGMMWWHQHEMLFGFGIAIVTGFLLTAVQNWTGIPTVKGAQLWLLALLWLSARVLMAYPMGLNSYLLMAIDVAFIPFVAIAMASYVIRAKRWRNLIFIPVLTLLTLANTGMHWGKISANYTMVIESAYMTVWLITSLIIVIGGRVLPMFTAYAMRFAVQPMPKWREPLTIGAALFVCLLHGLRALGVVVEPWLVALPLAALVVLNLLRYLSWQPQRCFKQPMIWGLHTSYLFVIFGAALWALAEFSFLRVDIALHTITVGGMMAIILSMMARVSLGHTGRIIRALPGKNAVLIALFAAGLLRGVGLLLAPNAAIMLYQISMGLSMLAFLWFLLFYTKTLWVPRADNRPG